MVTGPWTTWDKTPFGLSAAFTVAGQPYFAVNAAAAGQPPDCRLLTYRDRTWKAATLPQCVTNGGLVPEVPPDAGTTSAALLLGGSVIVTTDGGATWHATQPPRAGMHANYYDVAVDYDDAAKQPREWTLMSLNAGLGGVGGLSSGRQGNWGMRTELFLEKPPLRAPRLREHGTALVAWDTGQPAYVYRSNELLRKWVHVPIASAGETLLRLQFVPGSRNLLVQLRDPTNTRTSLCTFNALPAAPFWQRLTCAELPGINVPLTAIRFFTPTRYVAFAARGALLTTDGGASFTATISPAANESVAGISAYSGTEAIAAVRNTATGAYSFMASQDGGQTWSNL